MSNSSLSAQSLFSILMGVLCFFGALKPGFSQTNGIHMKLFSALMAANYDPNGIGGPLESDAFGRLLPAPNRGAAPAEVKVTMAEAGLSGNSLHAIPGQGKRSVR